MKVFFRDSRRLSNSLERHIFRHILEQGVSFERLESKLQNKPNLISKYGFLGSKSGAEKALLHIYGVRSNYNIVNVCTAFFLDTFSKGNKSVSEEKILQNGTKLFLYKNCSKKEQRILLNSNDDNLALCDLLFLWL